MKKPTKSVPEISEIRRASKARVAEVLGVSLTTVDRWIRDGMPVAQRNSKGIPWVLDLAEVLKWRYTPRTVSVEDPEKLPPGDRKAWYDGEAKRREIAERDAGLIPADEAREAVLLHYRTVVQHLRDLSATLATQAGLTPEQADMARTVIAAAAAEAAETLSVYAPELAGQGLEFDDATDHDPDR